MNMRQLITLGMLVFLAGGATAAAARQQDSVAEAARKARAKKKTLTKPAHVITQDDLEKTKAEQEGDSAAFSTVGPESPDSSAKGKGSGKDTAKNGDAADKKEKEDDNQEQKWRARFKSARENLERSEKELDILQREAAKADLQNYSDPNQAMKEGFSHEEINKKNKEIEDKKKEIDKLKQSLSDMEDELRKAGGDPAWAR